MVEPTQSHEGQAAPKHMDWSLVLIGATVSTLVLMVVGASALGPAHRDQRTLLISCGTALIGLLIAVAGFSIAKHLPGVRLLVSLTPTPKLSGTLILYNGLSLLGYVFATSVLHAPVLEFSYLYLGTILGGGVMLMIARAILPRDVWR